MPGERKWKLKVLVLILEELTKSQLKKFLRYLEKIPQGSKEYPSIEDLPQIIIECYGFEKSISAVDKALKQIPRNDATVQDLIRPFLGLADNNKKKKKRKHGVDKAVEEEEPSAGVSPPQSYQSEKENQIPPWRQSIKDLVDNGHQENKAIAGLVVQKSTMRTYETKEKVKKFFFYLSVADNTSAIKVMVYGKERYKEIKEGSTYLFRDVSKEDKVLKVFTKSKVSKTALLDVPEELKLEAQMLIYSQRPVYSIAKIWSCPDKMAVSVDGVLKEIGIVENIKLKSKRRKTDVQDFTLQDGSGSISVRLWGNDIQQLRGKSVGDSVRVINVKSNRFRDTVSLNSTEYTRIFKVQDGAMEKVTIEICGISENSAVETHLDVYLNDEVGSYVVDSAHLAKALGVRVKDLEDLLLEKIPFQAKAEIQGNKIHRIKPI